MVVTIVPEIENQLASQIQLESVCVSHLQALLPTPVATYLEQAVHFVIGKKCWQLSTSHEGIESLQDLHTG